MVEHNLKIGFKEPDHRLVRCGLVRVLDEVVEHLRLHELLHELPVLPLELVQVVVEVEHVHAGELIVN